MRLAELHNHSYLSTALVVLADSVAYASYVEHGSEQLYLCQLLHNLRIF